MKKEFRTYNGFILKEGKKYKWSGFSDGLYTAYRWTDCKCKIKSVDGDKITIYDYRDNIEYNYNNNQQSIQYDNNQLTIQNNNNNFQIDLLNIFNEPQFLDDAQINTLFEDVFNDEIFENNEFYTWKTTNDKYDKYDNREKKIIKKLTKFLNYHTLKKKNNLSKDHHIIKKLDDKYFRMFRYMMNCYKEKKHIMSYENVCEIWKNFIEKYLLICSEYFPLQSLIVDTDDFTNLCDLITNET